MEEKLLRHSGGFHRSLYHSNNSKGGRGGRDERGKKIVEEAMVEEEIVEEQIGTIYARHGRPIGSKKRWFGFSDIEALIVIQDKPSLLC